MHPKLAALGYRPEDEAVVRSYIDAMRHSGVPESRAWDAVVWYAGAYLNRSTRPNLETLRTDFALWAQRDGWATEHIDAGYNWHTVVNEAGGDPGVIRPYESGSETTVFNDDAKTIQEARELQRTDPHKYWRDYDLQHRYYEAIARSGDAAVNSPAPRSETLNNTASRASVDARLKEIKEMMYVDGMPNKKYWRDEQVQQEYRDLLGYQSGETTVPTNSGDGNG